MKHRSGEDGLRGWLKSVWDIGVRTAGWMCNGVAKMYLALIERNGDGCPGFVALILQSLVVEFVTSEV